MNESGIRFASASNAARICRRMPSLHIMILHAADDVILPVELGRRLYNNMLQSGCTNVRFVEFPADLAYGHRHIHLAPEVHQILRNEAWLIDWLLHCKLYTLIFLLTFRQIAWGRIEKVNRGISLVPEMDPSWFFLGGTPIVPGTFDVVIRLISIFMFSRNCYCSVGSRFVSVLFFVPEFHFLLLSNSKNLCEKVCLILCCKYPLKSTMGREILHFHFRIVKTPKFDLKLPSFFRG